MEFTRIYSIHDHAITFEFAAIISEEINTRVIGLKKLIEQKPFDGLIECVPAYSSLTVYFKKTADRNQIIDSVNSYNKALKIENQQDPTDIKIIPVCYELGEDLKQVAAELNMQMSEVIQLHSKPLYTVYMIGFLPGFPYMGILPEQLELPRKKTPSLRIPAGSVAIAGKQTGIYPSESPGGWHLIGKTPLKMFDEKRNPRCFLRAGDKVQFQQISKKEFDQSA